MSSSEPAIPIRKIAVAGVLGAVAFLLTYFRLGLFPVPNATGNATINHVPPIIGGVLEGPLVGAFVGGIFGLFSFITATSPLFKNPFVAIVPRLFIGVVAYLVYTGLRRWNEYAALALSGLAGAITNTVLVLGSAIAFGLFAIQAVPAVIPQATAEAIVAAIINVAVVTAWKQVQGGVGGSRRV